MVELGQGRGDGIRDGEHDLGGLGALAPRTKDANLAWVTVESWGGESEMSDGAVTVL